jgi:hypothetical protein
MPEGTSILEDADCGISALQSMQFLDSGSGRSNIDQKQALIDELARSPDSQVQIGSWRTNSSAHVLPPNAGAKQSAWPIFMEFLVPAVNAGLILVCLLDMNTRAVAI